MRRSNDLPPPATLIDMYRRVSLIQQNDDRFRAAIKAGKLVAPYYPVRGQEVIPAAVSVHLSDEDYICTIYRGVHDMLAKGIPVKLLWAEIAGRSTGACKGKGGPMHVTHPPTGVMITTGIVGSSMPVANGLAMAAQIRGEKRVTIAYFGDGASNIGAFHESLNMASLWKLPVVFVCQNNFYAEHTRFDIGTSVARIADRAAAYAMPGVTVDGNDPVAMWNVAGEAIERARAGEGPTLIEATTFRFHGHIFGDADAYMDPQAKKDAMAKDPVPRFRAWLLENDVASADELDRMEAEIAAEIDAAEAYAYASALPELAELQRDVYAEELAA